MRRKLICLFLALAIAALAACSSGTAASPSAEASVPAPSASPVRELPSTIEYGEPYLLADNAGPLWTYIRFPAAGNAADDDIAQWANDVYQGAKNELADIRKSDASAEGEVNIQFNSYLVDNRYAGVLEDGMSMNSHLAHPKSIIRTFNIDTESGTLLKNTDILDYTQLDQILSLMRDKLTADYPDAKAFLGEMDADWLEHITIGHEGIIVTLERSMFLPSYLGAASVTLPYGELGSAFLLGGEPTQVPEPPAQASLEPSAPPSAEPSVKPSAVPSSAPSINPTPTPIQPTVPPQGSIDPSKPMIALTFDDGPSKYTPQILDLLETYDCRATFCVIGNLVDARRETVKRAFDLGCEVIGHSWDHRDLTKLTADEIKAELLDTSAVIESATGAVPMMYRPPYGAVNDTLKNTSAELGYAIIYWSVDTLDWETRNADQVYSAVMSNAGDRAIVLCHDLYGSTAEAMERVIPALIAKGYQLVTVSELMYYSGKTLNPGTVYYSGK